MTTFTVKDNNKAIIGSTVNSDDHPIGYAMDDGTSYSFSSKLPNPSLVPASTSTMMCNSPMAVLAGRATKWRWLMHCGRMGSERWTYLQLESRG